jgi:transcriptional regulator with XRE-family HTH domain
VLNYISMQIGEKIRKIRSLKGYTQDYVADMLEMSQNNYSKIELGEVRVSTDMLERISQIFDLRPEDVITFDEKFIFNNHNTLNDHSHMVNVQNGLSSKERELYEALLKEKESKIVLLEKMTEMLNAALQK